MPHENDNNEAHESDNNAANNEDDIDDESDDGDYDVLHLSFSKIIITLFVLFFRNCHYADCLVLKHLNPAVNLSPFCILKVPKNLTRVGPMVL